MDPLAVLAIAVSKRDSQLSPSGSEIDPKFEIAEEGNESELVYHTLDSWASVKALTTEDVVLIVSGLCVALAGASYVAVAKAIMFTWRNRRYVTASNAKRVVWLVGLILSLAYYIGYNAGKKR